MSQAIALMVRSTDIVNRLVESGGELTPELEEIMNGLSKDVAGYADRLKFVMDTMDSYAEALGSKAKAYATAKTSLNNHQKKLNDLMKHVMFAATLHKVEGENYNATLYPVAEKLVIDEEKEIPPEYKIQTVSYELNRELIKEHLQQGKTIKGAHLEGGHGLRWSLAKGKAKK